MEKLEPVFCPIHGKELVITQEVIVIDGKETNLVVGKCPECQIRYIGEKKRLSKTGKKGSFIYNGKIYEYTPRMKQIELSMNREKLPVKFPETEKQIKQAEEMPKVLKDNGMTKAKLKLPKQICVISTFELERCPVCDKKTTFVPKKLVCEKESGRFMRGCECIKCHTPFVLEKTIEKYSLEEYIDSFNWDFWKVKLQNDNMRPLQANSVSMRELKEIEICVNQEHWSKCCIHRQKLGIRQVILKDEALSKEIVIGGGYCNKCKKFYITNQTKNKILNKFQVDSVIPNILKMKVVGKKWEDVPPISVTKIESVIDKRNKAKKEMLVKGNPCVSFSDDVIQQRKKLVAKKLPEEKNFKTEIAVASAIYDGEEVLIHVVRQLETGENVAGKADEICVRSLSLLGREILGRIAHKELAEFSTEKETVKIHQFKVWPGEEYNLYGFKKFTDMDKVQTITILNQKNLPSESEDYEIVTALVYCAGRDLPVYIDVYYSKLNDEYFINSDSYELYTRRYGLPYVRIISDEYSGNFGYDALRQQSELSLYGYTVGKNSGLTSGGRQRLLQQLLDNHFMTKSQIINHLEWLINTHKYRESMRDACDCWKEDLMYVHQCKINSQRIVWGKFAYKGVALK